MEKTKIFGIFVFLFIVTAAGCEADYGKEDGGKDAVKYDEKQIEYIGETRLWGFKDVEPGMLPDGFSNQITGKGGPGKWEVLKDRTAPGAPAVIAQTSQDYSGSHFNMAVNENKKYDDLELSVKFKGVNGEEDRGGGPVWRYQDPDNYYVARANPLENNFRVYKVVNGNRIQMDSARVKVTGNEWHTIKIINLKDRIQCYYDGLLCLEVSDGTFVTGKIGLWTKADAVTYFDDLEVRARKVIE